MIVALGLNQQEFYCTDWGRKIGILRHNLHMFLDIVGPQVQIKAHKNWLYIMASDSVRVCKMASENSF